MGGRVPIVNGRITNLEGDPIADVLVSLNSYWTNTSEDGTFAMEVPSGEYILKAVRRGYVTTIESISVTEDTSVRITLEKA